MSPALAGRLFTTESPRKPRSQVDVVNKRVFLWRGLRSQLSNGDDNNYLETCLLWKLNGKKKKTEVSKLYDTILIIQSPNLTEKHLQLETGSTLVVHEAGNPESKWLCSPVCKELGRLEQAAFLLRVHLSSPECLWLCAHLGLGQKTGGEDGRRKPHGSRDCRLGLFSSLGVSLSVSLSGGLTLGCCVISHPCNGHQR